jgi:hypothetical protein
VDEAAKRIEAIANRIRECLKEEGLEPEFELREQEGLVAARAEVEGGTLRVVAHVTTQESVPENAAAVEPKEARRRLNEAITRPTLEPRSAAGAHAPLPAESGPVREEDEAEQVE